MLRILIEFRYLDTIRSHIDIREELHRSWLFWCDCDRCADPTQFNTYLSSPLCEICNETSRVSKQTHRVFD